jgi:DNA mismatch repair protein MutS
MANRSMEVSDNNGEIVFLRKLKEGSTSNSYGLHAARLAGLPEAVLERAGEIMETLEASNPINAHIIPHEKKETKSPNEKETKLLSKLSKLDPDSLTPLEALNLIHEWKKSIFDSGDSFLPKRRAVKSESGGGPSLFDME